MKKKWIKKATSLFLCGMLVTAMTVGCSSKSTDSAVVEETSDKVVEDTSSIFGQLTAIDGNTLTIALVETGNMRTGEAPVMPDGESKDGEAPAMPDGESKDGEAPAMPDDDTGKGEMPDGEMPDGGFGNFALTGEESIITVDDATSFIISGSQSSLSDLQVEDIVTIEMSGDTVISITAGMIGGPSKGVGVSENTNIY